MGTFREYERAATTEVDAALSPLLAGYLRRLAVRCAEAGLPEPAIMQSSGGLMDLERAAGHAALTVLSGPAGGAAGAAFAARAAGVGDVLCFDMGGTSCDVCVVDRGRVQEQAGGTLAGRPIALPMLAVHTVGAGGGSIAWRDPGGALRVGPRSAGADPGPACYGRGGTEPTVTDANVVLGHLDPGVPLAGGVELDAEAAERAVAGLAATLGLSTGDCARGIAGSPAPRWRAALRVVTVDRGVDPRGYALLAFGGAGPLHAADVADALRLDKILIPRASGVLAALGLVAAPQRRDAQRSVFLEGDELTAAAMREHTAALAGQALAALGAAGAGAAGGTGGADEDASLTITLDTRYRGQSHELPIPAPAAATPASCASGSRPSTSGATDTATRSRTSSWSRSASRRPGPRPGLELAGEARRRADRRPGGDPAARVDAPGPGGLAVADTDATGTIHLERER